VSTSGEERRQFAPLSIVHGSNILTKGIGTMFSKEKNYFSVAKKKGGWGWGPLV
jgi:hypothetical protein